MAGTDDIRHDPTARLLRSAPYFPVRDVVRAIEYYEGTLGFRTEYVAGLPPEFAIVERDGMAVMLRRVGAVDIRPNELQGGTWDVFFWVEGLEALAEDLTRSGAELAYGPVTQDAYGMVEFAVRDPFGYVLGFGEPIASPR